MEPDAIHRRDGIQLSFNSPHRLNDACTYPRKAPNGSTLIICAHDEGLRFIWYAGKRWKQTGPSTNIHQSIDLTDEEDEEPQFLDEEDEIDPSRPYHNVLAYSDITFGIAATKIAVPPLQLGSSQDLHPVLNSHAIILAACSDLSLRLVCVPLTPPGSHTGSIQQVVIKGNNSHQDLVSAVALTITSSGIEDENLRQGKHGSASHDNDGREVKNLAQGIEEWSFLLASTSTTGTGLLLVHQIPIDANGQISTNPDDCIPVQRKYLRSSFVGCRIQFNPSLYPSQRHSNLLIASLDGTATKIYRAIHQSSLAKKRRGSTTTVDSSMSANATSKRNTPRDSVLIDLLTPFNSTAESAIPRRKRVLDAKWVLYGRAVVVLLEDGEWGIWDVEGAAPITTRSDKLVKGQTNISGLQGGSTTRFAIRGNVALGNASKQPVSKGATAGSDTSLAPMTPHTRKARSQDFLKGQDTNTERSSEQRISSRYGSLDVLVQAANTTQAKTQDECIAFSYGDTNSVISSLQSYWRAEGSSKGSFDGSVTSRQIVLPQLRTASEEQKSFHLLPPLSESSPSNHLFPATRSTQDFFVITPSRLILFVNPLTQSSSSNQKLSLPARLLGDSSSLQDQMLLNSGELDVGGMDRILDSMANTGTLQSSGSDQQPITGFGRKSVGFQLADDEDDVEMETPTAAKGARSRLVVNNSSARVNGGRNLFS